MLSKLVGAATTDFEGANSCIPNRWSDDVTAIQLAKLLDYEKYGRCCLYSESYVTALSYKKPKTRDNTWVVFQHHLHQCAPALLTNNQGVMLYDLQHFMQGF
jgi:hypothetical protein